MSKSRLILGSVVWASAAGCAVDRHVVPGFGSVEYFANPAGTARAVVVRNWGVHVTTGRSDAGVTVGRSVRAYVYAGPGSPGKGAEGSRLARVDAAEGDGWCLGRPLVCMTRVVGVEVGANRYRAGVSAGVRRSVLLSVPAGGSMECLCRLSGDGLEGAVVAFRDWKEGGE